MNIILEPCMQLFWNCRIFHWIHRSTFLVDYYILFKRILVPFHFDNYLPYIFIFDSQLFFVHKKLSSLLSTIHINFRCTITSVHFWFNIIFGSLIFLVRYYFLFIGIFGSLLFLVYRYFLFTIIFGSSTFFGSLLFSVHRHFWFAIIFGSLLY